MKHKKMVIVIMMTFVK